MTLLLLACASVGAPPDSGRMFDYPRPLLVSPAVEGVQWIDARPAADYAAGHIPGAANLSPADIPAPDAAGEWTEAQLAVVPTTLANRGVRADLPIVVYGDPLLAPADDGAIYWMLRHLGRGDLSLLDGGFPSWLAAGGVVDQETPAPGDFAATVDATVLATTADVIAAVEGGTPTVLDVRSQAEYDAGHVPGALRVEWDDVLDADGTFLPSEVIAEVLADLPEGPVITTCTRGVRAGHAFFTLELMGRSGVADYVGSWEAWSASGQPAE